MKPGRLVCLLISALIFTGCQWLASRASLSGMVPGGNLGTGELECWLTLEFHDYPKHIERRDVEVVFRSPALLATQSFDWAFIASRDLSAQGMGLGYKPNSDTHPHAAPPLQQPIKVRFPLRARRKVQVDLGDVIWLRAELYWGGVKQDELERPIEHMYKRT